VRPDRQAPPARVRPAAEAVAAFFLGHALFYKLKKSFADVI